MTANTIMMTWENGVLCLTNELNRGQVSYITRQGHKIQFNVGEPVKHAKKKANCLDEMIAIAEEDQTAQRYPKSNRFFDLRAQNAIFFSQPQIRKKLIEAYQEAALFCGSFANVARVLYSEEAQEVAIYTTKERGIEIFEQAMDAENYHDASVVASTAKLSYDYENRAFVSYAQQKLDGLEIGSEERSTEIRNFILWKAHYGFSTKSSEAKQLVREYCDGILAKTFSSDEEVQAAIADTMAMARVADLQREYSSQVDQKLESFYRAQNKRMYFTDYIETPMLNGLIESVLWLVKPFCRTQEKDMTYRIAQAQLRAEVPQRLQPMYHAAQTAGYLMQAQLFFDSIKQFTDAFI